MDSPSRAPGPLFHPLSIGSLEVPGNLFLAPVAGYTDRAFRSICAEMGANLTFTELASAEALVRGPEEIRDTKTGALIRRGEGEGLYAIQLFGGKSDTMYRAALRLGPLKPDIIDINAGCPVPKVVKTGAGAALTRDPGALFQVVAAVRRASEEALGGIPVTVKIRSGWDTASITYREAARAAVEAGAAMVSLHPRTRAQGYEGKSDWSCIADLAALLPVPVTGSGDLYAPQDAENMLAETGCAAVMFARGALGNPFIFRETRALLRGEKPGDTAPRLRLETAMRHLRMLMDDMGEGPAVREMRKQFGAYTRGIAGFARRRNALVRAVTAAECAEILGLNDSNTVL